MKKRIYVKPGKAQSTMGFAVGMIFCAIGLFVVIPTFGAFGIFWTLIAVVITVTNGLNAFTDKGVPTQSIEIDEQDESKESLEERLEQLNRLYDQRLITKEEFDAKKAEMLEEL